MNTHILIINSEVLMNKVPSTHLEKAVQHPAELSTPWLHIFSQRSLQGAWSKMQIQLQFPFQLTVAILQTGWSLAPPS